MLFHEELTGAARWAVPLLIFAVTLVGGLLLRAFLIRVLKRWTARTPTKIDDYIVASIRWPSILWCLIAALLLAALTIDLPGDKPDVALRRALGALLVLSLSMGASRLLSTLVRHRRDDLHTEAASASTGLMSAFVRVSVMLVGSLLVLSTLGINVAPLLGALGVGGLAAGLALQPTLSNLFAGFQIAVARQVHAGDRVRLASGEEGYVTDISWRTTTLRTPNNHLVIIPNSKFADTILTNYNLPDPPAGITLTVSVALDSNPRQVHAALLDEAKRAVAELPQLERVLDPVVRLQSIDAALVYNVVFRVHEFDGQFEVWNELNTRIIERLRRDGVAMPTPTRVVYLHQGTPPAPKA